MRYIHKIDNHLEEIPMETAMDDTISLALVERLKARIARRESRFKTRVVETQDEATRHEPPMLPAA